MDKSFFGSRALVGASAASSAWTRDVGLVSAWRCLVFARVWRAPLRCGRGLRYRWVRMSRPPPRSALLVDLPAPPEPLVDVDREERLRRIMVLWGGGAAEAAVVRVIGREFSVTPTQVKKDLADLRDYLRERMDDEGVIDAVMYTSAARANSVVEEFHSLALRPLPERVLEVPSPDPTQPELAIYRELTPSEQASLINAKATAARAAISAMEFQTKLLGKRSPKWADKPAHVVQVSIGKDGLTEEERELLRSLGMGS